MYKNSLYLVLFLLVLGCSACKKDNQKDVLFEMTYRLDFEIPAGLNVVEDHFFQFRNIESNLDSLLSFHGYTREEIGTINPKSAQLVSVFSGDEYDFVQEFSIYLYDGQKNNLIYEAYWRNEIPFNTGSLLQVPGTLLDATDFFEEDKIHIEARFDTRTTTTSFVNTRMDFTFVARRK